MSSQGLSQRTSRWIYSGVWGVLVSWFRVPAEPPSLPRAGADTRTFRPSEGFLKYLKFQFWIILLIIDGAILFGWAIIYTVSPRAGLWLAVPALVIAVVPDIIAYIAIHLRYDTTWYVMSDRSVRIRRGVWTIREITATYDNVQNVSINQGPLQRLFKVADLQVETAGGGGGGAPGHGGAGAGAHSARIEGIQDAAELRDLIMARVRASRTAGLGDESPEHPGADAPHATGWSPAMLDALTEIRDLVRRIPA